MERPGSKGTKQEWIDYADDLGADLNRAVDDLRDGATALEEAAAALEQAEAASSELEERIAALEVGPVATELPPAPNGISTPAKDRREWSRTEWRTFAEAVEADNAVLRVELGADEGVGVVVLRKLRTESAERYQSIRTLTDQLDIARGKLRGLGVV